MHFFLLLLPVRKKILIFSEERGREKRPALFLPTGKDDRYCLPPPPLESVRLTSSNRMTKVRKCADMTILLSKKNEAPHTRKEQTYCRHEEAVASGKKALRAVCFYLTVPLTYSFLFFNTKYILFNSLRAIRMMALFGFIRFDKSQ